MKFLCDRCKTRYSIGDDRVRGKILKIRCKNCANVITVREGMPEPDAGVPMTGTPRRNKTTTAAPMVQAESSSVATNGKHAPAATATKPPPALEEEWYVSIDGDQSGPYSLADAQRWVGTQPVDAELHCWSEGFDDWLPVDKVSHFRGLRKKSPPVHAGGPPPIPRIGAGPARALSSAATPPRMPEDEPKPLFAATMASLEKGSAPSAVVTGGGAAVNALRLEARASQLGPARALSSAATPPRIPEDEPKPLFAATMAS
ncbi:MAG: zinc-ribbon domain-containing protein, partial [Deltaproteobacteria bacterium]|nr:zinc-ribbon domain-containing protein [Deltaproteobacteria bacterium]